MRESDGTEHEVTQRTVKVLQPCPTGLARLRPRHLRHRRRRLSKLLQRRRGFEFPEPVGVTWEEMEMSSTSMPAKCSEPLLTGGLWAQGDCPCTPR